MTTRIVGSKCENSPYVDVFAKFPRLKDGTVPLNPEACIERAKIAANYGFLVDPFTGMCFWSHGDWRNPSVALSEVLGRKH